MCVYVCMCVMYLSPPPPHEHDATKGQIYKAEFNRFEFPVFLLLDRLPYQLTYYPYLEAWGNWVLTLNKMQIVSYRIWTRFVVSFFDDDNHYSTNICVNLFYERKNRHIPIVWKKFSWICLLMKRHLFHHCLHFKTCSVGWGSRIHRLYLNFQNFSIHITLFCKFHMICTS